LMAVNVYGAVKDPQSDRLDDLFAASGTDRLLELAAEHDIGIAAMKVQAGGNNQKLDKYIAGKTTAAQAKIKWVLSHPQIATACTEITNTGHLKEGVGAVGSVLTSMERRRLHEYCRSNSSDVCRMCGECSGACPRSIPIPYILRCRMYAEVYGKRSSARSLYATLPGKRSAAACDECGECESACPYGVAVRSGLRQAAQILA